MTSSAEIEQPILQPSGPQQGAYVNCDQKVQTW